MAFCNKVGSLLRHSVSQNGQASITSMLNYVRYMSSSKLFIGGLSYSTDDQSLKDAFAGFGEVVEARVIIDRETGRSRGFGFINYSSDEPATSAMSAMDGQELNGQNIRVSYANDSPAGPRSIGSGGGYDGGGGGGGGGGYGGGRGFGGGDGGY
ncbi:glycine-rich RNA-binding protein 2, mitochondrial-like [Alnus glutinosa]|uniref:glycine-rich RNA-binding protein 2, mitochondrial-like n=1 Tax=Alnus glutinosa TaxID=3517 RepID=UPI002D79FF01|nr:glycine-rich RNA-binding protein 2, mitochondrial-like [Alnus glutinosa]